MLKNLNIGKRLVMAFILVAIIASTSGIVSIFTTQNLDRQYSDALTNFGFPQGDVGNAMLALANSRCAAGTL